MRIIAGFARGMVLAVPRGDAVRPTSDRVREAIFSSLGDRVVGATVLDLFAGTGALGLEAASRGAQAVTFVEQNRAALVVLEKNVAAYTGRGGEAKLTINRDDVSRFLRRGGRFDVVFADPPYGELPAQLLADKNLPGIVGDRLVLESAKRDAVPVAPPWELVREGVYGDTCVRILARL